MIISSATLWCYLPVLFLPALSCFFVGLDWNEAGSRHRVLCAGGLCQYPAWSSCSTLERGGQFDLLLTSEWGWVTPLHVLDQQTNTRNKARDVVKCRTVKVIQWHATNIPSHYTTFEHFGIQVWNMYFSRQIYLLGWLIQSHDYSNSILKFYLYRRHTKHSSQLFLHKITVAKRNLSIALYLQL